MMGKTDIIKYSDAYSKKIIDLILYIQQVEFNLPITISSQTDLLDIPGTYQKGDGNFWLALSDQEVVGTVGLMDIGGQMGALRKMFVDKNYRGKGYRVAQRLMEELWRWAAQKKMHTIYLGTVENLIAAHHFYEKNGFERIDRSSLPPQFPVLEIDTRFYKYELTQSDISSSKNFKSK